MIARPITDHPHYMLGRDGGNPVGERAGSRNRCTRRGRPETLHAMPDGLTPGELPPTAVGDVDAWPLCHPLHPRQAF
jgi:hypothetical protein